MQSKTEEVLLAYPMRKDVAIADLLHGNAMMVKAMPLVAATAADDGTDEKNQRVHFLARSLCGHLHGVRI